MAGISAGHGVFLGWCGMAVMVRDWRAGLSGHGGVSVRRQRGHEAEEQQRELVWVAVIGAELGGSVLIVRASTRPWPRFTVQASPAIDFQGSASAASNSLGWFSLMVKMRKAPAAWIFRACSRWVCISSALIT